MPKQVRTTGLVYLCMCIEPVYVQRLPPQSQTGVWHTYSASIRYLHFLSWALYFTGVLYAPPPPGGIASWIFG